ncbi:MAG TPA: hypothetical protein VN030_13230 [Cellvibrio sp.]|nr:hypothetical protein [Cellvibrio sp.]
MTIKTFKILAVHRDPVTDDWRQQLIELLGSKPRRLSHWCELGLWGALSCIRRAGQSGLPNSVAIRICCELGAIAATRAALAQTREGLPMPFTFMQTQPGQIFNALGSALGWHGDGLISIYNNPGAGEAALLQGLSHSALLAWVDEEPQPKSDWIYLETRQPDQTLDWYPAASLFATDPEASWLKIVDRDVFQAR